MARRQRGFIGKLPPWRRLGQQPPWICSTEPRTLTRNRMTVREIVMPEGSTGALEDLWALPFRAVPDPCSNNRACRETLLTGLLLQRRPPRPGGRSGWASHTSRPAGGGRRWPAIDRDHSPSGHHTRQDAIPFPLRAPVHGHACTASRRILVKSVAGGGCCPTLPAPAGLAQALAIHSNGCSAVGGWPSRAKWRGGGGLEGPGPFAWSIPRKKTIETSLDPSPRFDTAGARDCPRLRDYARSKAPR